MHNTDLISSKSASDLTLVSLNLWGGYVLDPLLKFILSHHKIDMFCFQELYHNAPHKISADDKQLTLDLLSQIQQRLPDHNAYFRPVVNNCYGIGSLIKNYLSVIEEGDITIHENLNYAGSGPTHSRNLQWLKIENHNNNFAVLNIHGLWNGKGKDDSPERIAQSYKIKELMNTINMPMIVCGDFNLNPTTKSLQIIKAGMIDLIQEYNISSTRTSLYPKKERFADYIFVSEAIKVKQFEVLPDIVSDHAPLLLKFSL